MPSGPFVSIAPGAIPGGFDHAPPGGLCLSAFLFVREGERILLGKYADDPRWMEMVGLDPDRIRRNGGGWTVPASHLKLGEDPREAARRVAHDILGLKHLAFGEPRVATFRYELARLPGEEHVDYCFLVDATAPRHPRLETPPWYAELAWQDPARLPASAYARGHEDVVEAWRRPSS